jgi:hypothetical protein
MRTFVIYYTQFQINLQQNVATKISSTFSNAQISFNETVLHSPQSWFQCIFIQGFIYAIPFNIYVIYHRKFIAQITKSINPIYIFPAYISLLYMHCLPDILFYQNKRMQKKKLFEKQKY